MEFGLSTASLYPLFTENAVKEVSKADIPIIEIFLNSFCEMDRNYILNLKNILGNKKIISVHPFTSEMESFLFYSDYGKRFDDGLDLYKNYFEICNILGAKFLIFHGVMKNYPISDDESIERFFNLSRCAKQNGITLLQENVCRCRSGEIGYIKLMKENLKDNVSFALDLKQARRSNKSPFDVLEAMGGQISHVHISDSNQEHDCMLPFNGCFNFNKFIRHLNLFGFNGACLIEVYKDSYNSIDQLMKSYYNLKSRFSNNY